MLKISLDIDKIRLSILTTYELITIYNSLPKTGVKCECKVEGSNYENIVFRCREVVESEGNHIKKDQLIGILLNFNLNIRLHLNFKKLKGIWEGETDPKYDKIKQVFSSEDLLIESVKNIVLNRFEEVLPVFMSGEYHLFKELYYKWRGMIISNEFGF